VLAAEKPGGPVAERYQGGAFCVIEEAENPSAPARATGRKKARRNAKREAKRGARKKR
jgi:hypothetical protein